MDPSLSTVAEYLELGETAGIVSGRFTTNDPFPVEIDLDALL